MARSFAPSGTSVYLMDPDANEVAVAAKEIGGNAIVGDASAPADAEAALVRVVAETYRHHRQ